MASMGLKSFRTALLAAGLLASASLAHAGAVYRGHIDPLFYFGDILIDVDLSCIPASGFTGWERASFGAGKCGDVDVVSGTIFNQNTPPYADGTDQIDFGALTRGITGLYWVDGVLTGIDGLAGPGNSDADLPLPTMSAGYWLLFTSGHSPLEIFLNGGEPNDPAVNLFACSLEVEDKSFTRKTLPSFDLDCVRNLGGDAAGQVSFVLVPEPGSLALLLAAVGAGWIVRRRSSTSVKQR